MYEETVYTGPETTPRTIKFLLLCTIGCSLFWAICSKFFPLFSYEYLRHICTLTAEATFRGYFWQLVIYPFVQPVFGSISMQYLLDLAFRLYLTWVIGSSLISSKGEASFLSLYFSGVVFAGVCTSLTLGLIGSPAFFVGSHVPSYILLFTWMMLNPYARVYLFFTIPMGAPLLILGAWGSNLFLALMDVNISLLVSYLCAGLYGYFYSVIVYKVFSPIFALRSFESTLQNLSYRKEKKTTSKIYDFKTGKKLSEEEVFMDAMLAKITKHGKASLTKEELQKMDEIAKKLFS